MVKGTWKGASGDDFKDGTAAPGGSLTATSGYPALGLATLCQDQQWSAKQALHIWAFLHSVLFTECMYIVGDR